MGTCIDHLYRRRATYWWRRRVPAGLSQLGLRRVARSLRTTDPALARRRCRACSAAYDRAILQLMLRPSPTREDLQRVLDDIFHRILQDGERTRAERDPGPPPWTPEPQTDPRYEGLEPEEWDAVPYPPDQWTQDWRNAVMCNAQEDVRPLVEDALSARQLALPPDSAAWRRLCRLSLVVAARAYEINARREWGDYSDGWPASADVPVQELPGAAGSTAANPRPANPPPQRNPSGSTAEATLLLSESFAEFFASQSSWSAKYRKQADVAVLKFVSLMGDLPVSQITRTITGKFRDRLQELPRLYGKSLYAGMSPSQALTTASRFRADAAAGKERIAHGGVRLDPKRLAGLIEPTSKKTVNRDFSVFTSWGKWMVDDEERARALRNGACPFAGKAFKSSEAKKESRLAGRSRVAFTSVQLTAMLRSKLFLAPPHMRDAGSDDVELQRAQFWAVLIGLYTGMRLGEISMLRPGDFQREDGIAHINLVSDRDRSFKSEAGDRKIPLHPDLVRLQLMEFAQGALDRGSPRLFPGMKDSKVSQQRGANISKWFGRWRKSLGVDSARTPFHAFRKTFETRLKAKFVGSDTLVDQIVGHEPSSVGASHYTDPLPLTSKAEAVAKIDYEIDISSLVTALALTQPPGPTAGRGRSYAARRTLNETRQPHPKRQPTTSPGSLAAKRDVRSA